MFPIRDENPTLRTPVATIAIIALNVASWVFVQQLGSGDAMARSLCLYGLIPGDLLASVPAGTVVPLGDARCVLQGDGSPVTLVTSMFLHGGWFHLIGNLWFLWIFGDNVEDAMGPDRFALFYLLCGLAAAVAQIATDVQSALPMVGASGAIGGVMGAYARLYPRTRIHTVLFFGFFFTTISIPAIAMLGYWFLIQILGGLPALASEGGGVAFWAHIGGFVAGIALIGPMTRPELLANHRAATPRRTARHRWG
ncbi:MAG: rhomboid family intramembrane serine protease [Myxococcota bacterium]